MSWKAPLIAGGAALTVIIVAASAWLIGRSLQAPTSVQWLLTYGAGSATLTVEESGTGTLRLGEPDSTVLMFSDRPERRTATISIPALAAAWDTWFASSAPNAALVDDASGDALAVVTLGRPTVEPDGVSFPVSDVTPDQAAGAVASDGPVHLFIDPPAARLTDFHETPMVTPSMPGSLG